MMIWHLSGVVDHNHYSVGPHSLLIRKIKLNVVKVIHCLTTWESGLLCRYTQWIAAVP